ncbi:MAG: cupin-like domain-containing protein [Steroidobacteraceae bacterium]
MMLRSVSLPDGVVAPSAGGRLLSAQPLEFRQKFNVKPFQFKHTFANSPLFSLSHLAVVAERMLARGDLEKFVARSAKTALCDARFKDMPLKAKMAETVGQLAESKIWLKISSAHTADPEYNEFLQQVLREVEELSDQPLHEMITWSALTVFLASPGVTTPYHIDHESNFLFQVQGSKDVSLHDPNERDVVPEVQLERFYAGDFEAAQYRPELQYRATVFHLDPGRAVHHPPLAPHWVQNGNDVSVSVSIGICLQSIDRVARVYQVNHLLRRCGLEPTPPGKSKLRDGLKKAGIGMISKSNPSTPDEILFSGLTRLSKPPRAIKRWVRSLRHSH